MAAGAYQELLWADPAAQAARAPRHTVLSDAL
jgi:hypothetical protein